jgi:hypothetical protein
MSKVFELTRIMNGGDPIKQIHTYWYYVPVDIITGGLTESNWIGNSPVKSPYISSRRPINGYFST